MSAFCSSASVVGRMHNCCWLQTVRALETNFTISLSEQSLQSNSMVASDSKFEALLRPSGSSAAVWAIKALVVRADGNIPLSANIARSLCFQTTLTTVALVSLTWISARCLLT